MISGAAAGVPGTRTVTLNIIVPPPPDFSLSASPVTLTLVPGATGKITFTMTALNGWNAATTLAIPAIPNVTVAPTSAPFPGTGGSVDVLFTVSPAAPNGTLPFTATATTVATAGPPIVRTANATLVVQPPPDFSLSIAPLVVHVFPGDTAPVTVTANPLYGFTGAVDVTTPSLPGVSFNPPAFTVAAGATQVVQVTVGAGQAPGTSTVTFSGTSKATAGSRTAAFSLAVDPKPDFQLQVSPPSVTIGPSGTAQVTVSAQPLNGFTSPVSVTAPLLAGITFNPASFSVPAGGSQTVDVVGTNAAAGTFAGDFSGTAVNLLGARTAPISVTVTGGPDFQVLLAPASLTLQPGGTGTTNVSIAALNGLGGTFNVTVAPPADLTMSPTSFTLAPGAVQAVTVTAGPAAGGVLGATFSGTSTQTGAVRTAALSVSVPRPDYVLTLAPSSLRIAPGGSSPVAVSATPLNGFAGVVTVVPALPAGIDVDQKSFTLGPGESKVVTVSLAAGVGTGFLTVPFNGTTPGGPSHAASLAISVETSPDFTLAVTPAVVTLAAGGHAAAQVTLVPLNGWSGGVDVTVTGSAGISVVPSAFPLSPGVPFPVDIRAADDAPAGAVTLLFKASGANGGAGVSVTRLVNVQVTVSQADFNVRATPPAPSVLQGRSTDLTFLLDPINGFAGMATLTAVSLPPGVSLTPPQPVLTPNVPQAATLAIPRGLAAGTYTLVFRADEVPSPNARRRPLLISKTLNVPLVVQPAAGGFTVTVSPTTVLSSPDQPVAVRYELRSLSDAPLAITGDTFVLRDRSGTGLGVVEEPLALTLPARGTLVVSNTVLVTGSQFSRAGSPPVVLADRTFRSVPDETGYIPNATATVTVTAANSLLSTASATRLSDRVPAVGHPRRARRLAARPGARHRERHGQPSRRLVLRRRPRRDGDRPSPERDADFRLERGHPPDPRVRKPRDRALGPRPELPLLASGPDLRRGGAADAPPRVSVGRRDPSARVRRPDFLVDSRAGHRALRRRDPPPGPRGALALVLHDGHALEPARVALERTRRGRVRVGSPRLHERRPGLPGLAERRRLGAAHERGHARHGGGMDRLVRPGPLRDRGQRCDPAGPEGSRDVRRRGRAVRLAGDSGRFLRPRAVRAGPRRAPSRPNGDRGQADAPPPGGRPAARRPIPVARVRRRQERARARRHGPRARPGGRSGAVRRLARGTTAVLAFAFAAPAKAQVTPLGPSPVAAASASSVAAPAEAPPSAAAVAAPPAGFVLVEPLGEVTTVRPVITFRPAASDFKLVQMTLDGVIVTQLVSANGGIWRFEPFVEIAGGPHTVEIVWSSRGVSASGAWTFQTAAPPPRPEAAFGWSFGAEVARTHGEPVGREGPTTNATSITGVPHLEGSVNDPVSGVQTAFNGTLAQNVDANALPAHVAPPAVVVTAKAGIVSGALGNGPAETFAPSPLLQTMSTRRGLELGLDTNFLSLRAFGNIDDGLPASTGVNEYRQSLYGVSLMPKLGTDRVKVRVLYQFVQDEKDPLYQTPPALASPYGAAGAPAGTPAAQPAYYGSAPKKGNLLSFSADLMIEPTTNFMLRGEAVRSEFTSDLNSKPLQDDWAYAVLLTANPAGFSLAGGIRLVGDEFGAPANPALIAGRKVYDGSVSRSFGALSLSANYAHTVDSGGAGSATTGFSTPAGRADAGSLTASYSFAASRTSVSASAQENRADSAGSSKPLDEPEPLGRAAPRRLPVLPRPPRRPSGDGRPLLERGGDAGRDARHLAAGERPVRPDERRREPVEGPPDGQPHDELERRRDARRRDLQPDGQRDATRLLDAADGDGRPVQLQLVELGWPPDRAHVGEDSRLRRLGAVPRVRVRAGRGGPADHAGPALRRGPRDPVRRRIARAVRRAADRHAAARAALRAPAPPRAPVYDPRPMAPRVDWHRYFMNIAHEVASRATCPRKHVGAVIVRDKRILSTGYNGSLRGLPHCDEVGCLMEDGHCVATVHAEANAILQAAMNGVRIEGGEIYTTASPCWNCFKLVANAGLNAVYFGEFYREERIHDYAEKVGIQLVDLSALAPGA